ncbi:hypothetical protein [Nannocystis sp. SCPEA4]|uniref:hypothetical protein n=1 Tax=Nannocystis sp. SCPEA4 TaxID=2996787 RepID=UPI00226E848B|nr:hypothetical protein [Nannocystis sp. SCPEA4]MCY1056433.1 hypothetical protein [Nannocystis sp. SCPEA4]
MTPSVTAADAPTAEPRDGGCLPAELHGSLVALRGGWNLYRSLDPQGTYSTHLLEHVGPRVIVSEGELSALRAKIPGEFWTDSPTVRSIGVGNCGDGVPDHVSRMACLHIGVVADADPLAVASRLDEHLGELHRDLCFGVAVGPHRELSAF